MKYKIIKISLLIILGSAFLISFNSAYALDVCIEQGWSPSYHQVNSPDPGYDDHSVQIFEYGACGDNFTCKLSCMDIENKNNNPEWYKGGGQCVDTCGKTLSEVMECPYCASELVPGTTDRNYCCVINSEDPPHLVTKLLQTDGTVSAVSDAHADAEAYAARNVVNNNVCCCYTEGARQCGIRPAEQGCPDGTEISDYDRCLAPPANITLSVPIGKTTIVRDLPEYISVVYNYALYAIVILAVVMIVLGGLQWILAAGNASKIDTAKSRVVDALVGLSLAMASYLILYIVNPAILDLHIPGLERILPIYQETKAGTIYDSSGNIIKCSDPDTILNYSSVIPGLPSSITNLSEDLKNKYKTIAIEEQIPWQVLATIHYREVNNNPSQSLLNGKELCNDRNETRCRACDDGVTLENDMRCSARLFKQKAGGKNSISETDYDTIKDAFWGYNGRAYGCADASPYVANNFDEKHQNIRIQVHDCVPMNCKDCTKPSGSGCCKIQKGLRGCDANHSSRCLQGNYYVYQPIQYTNSNCGTYRTETHDGAMKVYLNLLNQGT